MSIYSTDLSWISLCTEVRRKKPYISGQFLIQREGGEIRVATISAGGAVAVAVAAAMAVLVLAGVLGDPSERRSRQRRQRASVGKISAQCFSFSAVSAPIFARKYAFCSIFQNLPDSQTEIFEI